MCCCAPDIREAVVGDLLERVAARQSLIALWQEVIRSAPHLLLDRLRRSDHLNWLAAALVIAVVAASAWERYVVQLQAWPVTARFLDRTVLSNAQLYIGVTTALYLVGCALLATSLAALARANRRQRSSPPQFAWFVAIGLSVPPLYYLVSPSPMDFTSLRLVQLGAIWCVAILVQWRNPRPT